MTDAEIDHWAAQAAVRLRVVQGTKLELDPEAGPHVWEFVSEAMKEIAHASAEVRLRCMRALDREFPFFMARAANAETDRGEAADEMDFEGGRDESPKVEGFETYLTELVAQAANMSDEDRQRVSQSLADAGFTLSAGGVADPSRIEAFLSIPEMEDEQVRLRRMVQRIAERIGTEVGTGGGKGFNLNRCMQMLGLLVDQYLTVHEPVWTLWDKLVSGYHYTTSFHRPTLSVTEGLAVFMRGGSSVKKADVGEMIAKTFFLIRAMATAVDQAGAEFAQWFYQKYSPESIENYLGLETGTGKAGPAELWQHYLQVTGDNNEAEFREQFRTLLGKAMLQLLQTKSRPTE